MRARPWFVLLLLTVVATAPSFAQQPTEVSPEEAQQRAEALATRRAARDASRAERMSSRPFVLREPVPLPVDPVRPAGGDAAGRACPATESCTLDYAVPAGRLLVVTALWAASEAACDGVALGASPANGDAIAPWWQCRTSLRVTGTGAGFAGFLFSSPQDQ